jgi:hypothetical protein
MFHIEQTWISAVSANYAEDGTCKEQGNYRDRLNTDRNALFSNFVCRKAIATRKLYPIALGT